MTGGLDIVLIEQSAERFLTFTGGVRPPPDAVFIMVMGMTGAGKSSFVAACSGQEVTIGHGLESCTSDIAIVDFMLDGRRVFLIDTPGFNDTNRADTDTLRVIGTYLGVSYAQGVRISGIIYLHAIDDNRMTGSKQRNLDMLKAMCGPQTHQNTTIATTMWSKPETSYRETEMYIKREAQLKHAYFAEILAQGARLVRHAAGNESPRESARGIVRSVVRQSRPIILSIQRELVDGKKALEDTEAGMVICAELREALAAFRQETEALQADMENLLQTRDKKHAEEVADARRKLRAEIEKNREQFRAMTMSMDEMRQREIAQLENRHSRVEQDMRAELQSLRAELNSTRELLEQRRRQQAQTALQLGTLGRRTEEYPGQNQQQQQLLNIKKQQELEALEKRLEQQQEEIERKVQEMQAGRAKMEYIQSLSSALATSAVSGLAGALCIVQ